MACLERIRVGRVMGRYVRWKALERRHAKRMGGRRLWRARDYSESVPDGETAGDVWDAKDRVSIAPLTWFREAERKYRGYVAGRRFHLVLCDRAGRGDFVLVRADDFAALVDLERRVRESCACGLRD